MTGYEDFALEYALAVLSYWWTLVPGIVLAAVDLIAKARNHGLHLPRPLFLNLLVAGFVAAQFLAYRDLWWEHFWLRPQVLQELIELSQEGEKILHSGLDACKQKSKQVDTVRAIGDWEEKVVAYLKGSRLAESSIAEFKSDTGWTISGRMAMQCSDDNFALLLSKQQQKIEILKVSGHESHIDLFTSRLRGLVL